MELNLSNVDTTSPSYHDLIGQPTTFIRAGPYKVHFGSGVPAATLGQNNEYYVRWDGAAGASTTLYHKEVDIFGTSAWVACIL